MANGHSVVRLYLGGSPLSREYADTTGFRKRTVVSGFDLAGVILFQIDGKIVYVDKFQSFKPPAPLISSVGGLVDIIELVDSGLSTWADKFVKLVPESADQKSFEVWSKLVR